MFWGLAHTRTVGMIGDFEVKVHETRLKNSMNSRREESRNVVVVLFWKKLPFNRLAASKELRARDELKGQKRCKQYGPFEKDEWILFELSSYLYWWFDSEISCRCWLIILLLLVSILLAAPILCNLYSDETKPYRKLPRSITSHGNFRLGNSTARRTNNSWKSGRSRCGIRKATQKSQFPSRLWLNKTFLVYGHLWVQ